MRAAIEAWIGGVGDLFGRPLRGLILLCLVLTMGLLGLAFWAALEYVTPLLPALKTWPGWLTVLADWAAATSYFIAAIVLMPVVAMVVGGALFDVAAARVEGMRFPRRPALRKVGLKEALLNSLRIAGPALLLNVLAIPLYFFPVVNVLTFIGLNAFLMGREYFSLAALRFGDWAYVRRLRRKHGAAVLLGGLAPALLLVVPLLQFLAPLFGAAVMVRLHRALATEEAAEAKS